MGPLDANLLSLPENWLPLLTKNLNHKPKLMKGKRLIFFQNLEKKQASHIFYGQEKNGFEVLFKVCGHNSDLTPLKIPRTLKIQQKFSQQKSFFGRILLWAQIMQPWQRSREFFCIILGKFGSKTERIEMKSIELLSKLSKKIDFKNSSGQENSNFEFPLKRCGHNSNHSAVKYPRTNKMKQFFSIKKLLAENLFGGLKNAALTRLPRNIWRVFEKKTWIKHRKGWKKKDLTSFKNKKKIYLALLLWKRSKQFWQRAEKIRPKLRTFFAEKCEINQNI